MARPFFVAPAMAASRDPASDIPNVAPANQGLTQVDVAPMVQRRPKEKRRPQGRRLDPEVWRQAYSSSSASTAFSSSSLETSFSVTSASSRM